MGVLWFSAFWQSRVCHGVCAVCHYVGAKWLLWVVCVCVYVGWVLLAVQVWKCVGGERCVDLETQKEGKKSTPKGREAEVTSTVKRHLKKEVRVPPSPRSVFVKYKEGQFLVF